MADAAEHRSTPSVPLETALVARMYFIDDKQKSEIAKELGISRFKVARLLDDARASGIVRISIDMPTEIDLALGDRLARAFDVPRAIVVRSSDASPGATAAVIGAAAADYLSSSLGPRSALGISWGSTLTSVVDAAHDLADVDIVQLVGGSTNIHLRDSGVELVRRLSQRSGGRAFPLHAPLLVRTREMAQQLRAEPSLADTFDRFSGLDAALIGVGSWHPAASSLLDELTPDERRDLSDLGAAADVCSIVVDSAGHTIETAALHRSIGISASELRHIPDVIAVAGGTLKVAALAAVLRSGLVKTVITDSSAAAALLDR